MGLIDDSKRINEIDQQEERAILVGLITPQQGTIAVETGKKQSVINDQLPAMSFRIYRIKK